uniref:Uncharacterized protein n=1 Tax=viral metagenome TaxID=1070528 RepID=A0A6C0C506_9ZZZZ
MEQQMGGNQLTFEAIMTPNFLYFVITLAVIGYLYQTKMVLSREQQVKLQSANLFDKQLYLEVGFMILIGLSMYILNNGENTTFVWLYMLIPIVYLVLKSLMVFNKVTDYIKDAPTATDVDSDLADLISQQANANTNTQIPVTNQNSNTVDISNALNNALSKNSQYTNSVGVQQPQQPQQPPPQVPQQFQNPMNTIPEGFSLF